MDDRRGNLKCHSPWDYKIVRHSWERHLSRENLTSRSGHSCENHLSRRKPNLMISNDKHRKPLSIETPGINSASELSLLKVCFCIQQCTPCFSHKTSKNRECWLCVSPRCLCTYGWGNAHSLQWGWGTTRVSLGQVFADLFTKVGERSFFKILRLKEIYNKLK